MVTVANNLFGRYFNVIKAFNLERIAFKAFRVWSAETRLLDDNTLGKTSFHPFSVDNSLVT